MLALVYTAPGIVEMQDVDEPELADGEVLIDVALAGICGSEIHGVRSESLRTPPLIMGHEFVGRDNDGRRVAVNPLIACGSCDACRDGRSNICRHRTVVGIQRAGALAERVAVPLESVHVLPPEVGSESGALIEPLANTIHAWTVGGCPAGKRVGIVGAGTIGLLLAHTARERGANDLAVADVADERLRTAAGLGFDASSALAGEFDVTFDCVGSALTRATSVNLLRAGGTAVWIGLLDNECAIDALDLVRQEKSVRGSYGYTDAQFGEAVQAAAGWTVGWTQTYPLRQGALRFRELAAGRADVVKVLLQP